MSEYDPIVPVAASGSDDLERARDLFAAASRPFLVGPVPWLTWAVLLPAAALATMPVLAGIGAVGVLALWSLTILLGGAVELAGIRRGRRRHGRTPLGGWAMTVGRPSPWRWRCRPRCSRRSGPAGARPLAARARRLLLPDGHSRLPGLPCLRVALPDRRLHRALADRHRPLRRLRRRHGGRQLVDGVAVWDAQR